MSNPGMDPDIFEQFIDQLERYVRERLIPAEKDVIETDKLPDDILTGMKEMGLLRDVPVMVVTSPTTFSQR